MDNISIYKSELTTSNLDASMTTLTAKLQELQAELSEDDRKVFADIIVSAADHLSTIRSASDIGDKLSYIKPISAIPSFKVRSEIEAMPKTLNLN